MGTRFGHLMLCCIELSGLILVGRSGYSLWIRTKELTTREGVLWSLERVVDGIDRITGRIALFAAWLVVPLFLIMGYEVFARFVLGWPTFWSWELAYMITGTHFVLGIAYVTRKRRHVRVDFLYSRFKPRMQAAIDGVVYVFFLLPVSAWMTWRLGIVFVEAYQNGETSGESAWNPQIWPIRFIVMLGFGLFTLQVFAEAGRCCLAVFTDSKQHDDRSSQ